MPDEDYEEYTSGPYCPHWREPGDCDEVCLNPDCKHRCHIGDCYERDCPCEKCVVEE